MHLTSSPIDWYAARAAGIAAYVMLTAVILIGLGLASHAPGRRWRRWPMFAVEDVHRVGGLMVGSFIAVHLLTIAIDSFLPFSPRQLVVPFIASYRPVWTGLGIAAAELLVALAITNRYRKRLRYRLWRLAHYANFAVWIAATLHGLGAGTDRDTAWAIALYATSTAAVSTLTLWRISSRWHGNWSLRPVHAATGAGAAALVAATLAFGPFATHARPWNAASFGDRLTGQVMQRSGASSAIVSMTGVGHGSQNVLVRADLLVSPGTLEATTFQMEFLPSGLICRGEVTHVEQFGFRASCAADGRRRVIDANWQLVAGNRLVGILREAPG